MLVGCANQAKPSASDGIGEYGDAQRRMLSHLPVVDCFCAEPGYCEP